MKDEYIIINRTTLEKRIKELENIEAKLMNEGMAYTATRAKIDELYYILHASTPLIYEIEKGIRQGLSICLSKKDWAYGISGSVKQDIKDYISNLKLDI